MEKIQAEYLVWNPNGRVPMKRHAEFWSAANEAERLAKLNGGEEFFVLKSVARLRRPPEVEVAYAHDFDCPMPF